VHNTHMHISFIGLGNMGRPMAANLLKAGFDLTVWNRSPQSAADLVAAGATHAASRADASRADVVITMLADDAAVEQVAFEGRLVELLPRDAIHVSMSTISVRMARRLAAAHRDHGNSYVSAPVFGRPAAAAEAKLFVVCAGAATALDRLQPIFDAIGQRTFRFGEQAEHANVVKLSGNFLIASVIESVGEAVALSRKSGIDPHAFVDLLTSTLFAAPVYKTYGGLIADERYHPAGFRLPLGLKDVTLVLEAARDQNVPLPIASLVRDRMIEGLAQGFEDADWSVLGAVAARAAGLNPSTP
jgi:3-hydroxyisobutyrate dehydrogenase-like beta-hydroxyacid dehydrogenase